MHGGVVVGVALAGVAVKFVATLVLSGADRKSLNVRGAFLHVATDLAAFVGTAIAGALVLVTGWSRFDPIAGLLVAALMLRSSWSLLRDSGRIFLEAAPAGIDPDAVAATLAADPDVVEVHDLHVGTVTSGFPALAAHVLVSPDADCHAARRRLEELLTERFGLSTRPCRSTTWLDAPRSLASSAVDLTGKTAIVTGASSGFGRSTSRMLKDAGVRVAGGARRTERLETEVALELDVTDPESSERFVAAAVEQLGGIDILINNAGLALGRAPFDESSEEDERRVFETDVQGLVRMTRLCLPHIRDEGHIVNLGSIAGRQAYEGAATYVAAKFAVRSFTYALGEDEVRATKDILGFDPDRTFEVAPEVLEHARRVAVRGKQAHARWQQRFDAWRAGTPMAARCWNGCPPARCRRAGRTPCRPGTPIRRAWPPGRPPARFSLPCIRSCRSCGAVRPTWRRVTAPRSMGRPRSCPRTGRPRCGRAARTGARSTSASVSTPWARS